MENKLVILFSGKIGSGKNTCCDLLKEEIESVYKVKVIHEFFARALKEKCRDSFRPLTDFLNKTFEELTPVYDMEICGCEEFHKSLITRDDNWFENKNDITRHILQIIGTDIVRSVDSDYWTKKTIENIKNSENELFIISDLRFKNELVLVQKEFRTISIRVERNIERNNSFNEHISETALDDYNEWDFRIKNDGTLEELKTKIQGIVKNYFHV